MDRMPDATEHTFITRFRIPKRMWQAYGTVAAREGVDRSADLVDHVRDFIRKHGNEQERAELAAADEELTERRARKGGRPKYATPFTGVLAVLHATTADRRRLDEPAPELTRPLPLPLVRPGEPGIGRIDRVWRDGNLIRYSGHLNDTRQDAAEIRTEIEAGRLVGNLDVDGIPADGMRLVHQGRVLSQEEVDALPLDADVSEFETVMSGWRVRAATLMPSDGRAWPEVSLTLGGPATSKEQTA
jgi:hypothetical protein